MIFCIKKNSQVIHLTLNIDSMNNKVHCYKGESSRENVSMPLKSILYASNFAANVYIFIKFFLESIFFLLSSDILQVLISVHPTV